MLSSEEVIGPGINRIELVEHWPRLEELSVQWDQLAASLTVFQTFAWHHAWWEAFGKGRTLLTVVVFRGDELVAIAPLTLSRGVLEFIGASNHASDYCDFLCRPEHAEEALTAIARALTERRRCWRRIRLSNMPEQSALRDVFMRACRDQGHFVDSEPCASAPTRLLGDEAADREVVGKKSLKRHFNHFAKLGRLEFRHLEDPEEIRGRLDGFFAQHIARRAGTRDKSQFLDPRQREFYHSLVEGFSPKGWLRFSVVELDGAPIAFHFGFEYGGRYIWYKPSFDPAFSKHSPGEVLLKFLLEHAIARRLGEFDFTVGDEAFKFRFANRVRVNHRVLVFTSRFAYLFHRWKRSLRALVRRAPARLSGAAREGA